MKLFKPLILKRKKIPVTSIKFAAGIACLRLLHKPQTNPAIRQDLVRIIQNQIKIDLKFFLSGRQFNVIHQQLKIDQTYFEFKNYTIYLGTKPYLSLPVYLKTFLKTSNLPNGERFLSWRRQNFALLVGLWQEILTKYGLKSAAGGWVASFQTRPNNILKKYGQFSDIYIFPGLAQKKETAYPKFTKVFLKNRAKPAEQLFRWQAKQDFTDMAALFQENFPPPASVYFTIQETYLKKVAEYFFFINFLKKQKNLKFAAYVQNKNTHLSPCAYFASNTVNFSEKIRQTTFQLKTVNFKPQNLPANFSREISLYLSQSVLRQPVLNNESLNIYPSLVLKKEITTPKPTQSNMTMKGFSATDQVQIKKSVNLDKHTAPPGRQLQNKVQPPVDVESIINQVYKNIGQRLRYESLKKGY